MELERAPQGVFVSRLVLGLAQGLALYLLYLAFDEKTWPATVPMLFAPLAVVALFIPLLVSQALGNLRPTTLAVWAAAAALIVAGLAWYDIWHAWPGQSAGSFAPPVSPKNLLTCAVFLFVAHALVSCGDADRRVVAHYPTLFDLAWKLGVQVAITVCFVAAFWIMLWLGIALFDMIKLTGFGVFIRHPWIWIPLTTIAAAAAIHITDTRASLVRGVRTLALTLLGWLLPVIALIAFAFLIALVFTGLTPLWETRSATFLLIAAAAVLVIHINAAYQDGDGDRRPHHILRVAGTLASVLLIFIVWIAAYALWLRVAQYGWTVDRITSAACVLVAGMFAIGYLIAAILPTPWLKLIERWNVYGTFVFLIVLFALSTPIADPMRLSVADQMHRLQTGVVKPEKLDVWYLRNHGGRFGRTALASLSKSEDKTMRKAAFAALTNGIFPLELRQRPLRLTLEETSKSINVYPAGKVLPVSFVQQTRADGNYFYNKLEECRIGTAATHTRCDAVLDDFDGDGSDEILIIIDYGFEKKRWWNAYIFKQNGAKWEAFAELIHAGCESDRDALIAGKFKTVVPLQRDLLIQGNRLGMAPMAAAAQHVCQ